MFRSYRSLAIACLAVVAMATTGLAAQGKAKSASITGTLQKVDGQTLTIQTSKGTETVMLDPHGADSSRVEDARRVGSVVGSRRQSEGHLYRNQRAEAGADGLGVVRHAGVGQEGGCREEVGSRARCATGYGVVSAAVSWVSHAS